MDAVELPVDIDSPSPAEANIARERVRASLFGGEVQRPRFGRYQLEACIGHGGMGEVYAARDEQLARTVAIKCVRSDRVSDGTRERILREARAMAKLSHPNVAAIYEVGEAQGRLFIAMERVEGVTLDQWVRDEERSWREILDAYLQAGEALAAAHAADLVHRDFKPQNAMMGVDGRVRVLDFGLVSDAREDAATLDGVDDTEDGDPTLSRATRTGSLLGSPAYMSPEQHGRRRPGPQSDQFSFCVSLHEALYGRRPFEGKTVVALRRNVVDGDLRLGNASGVPPWIRACLHRGLQNDPADRWPTMTALLEALRSDPRRRRWLIGIGVGSLAVALAIAGWQHLDRETRAQGCIDEGKASREGWGDARAQALAAGFDVVRPGPLLLKLSGLAAPSPARVGHSHGIPGDIRVPVHAVSKPDRVRRRPPPQPRRIVPRTHVVEPGLLIPLEPGVPVPLRADVDRRVHRPIRTGPRKDETPRRR